MKKQKDTSKLIIYAVAILTGLWMPVSTFLNPGWFTLGLFYAPNFDMWLPAVVPLLVFLVAHSFRPKGWRIPSGLFRLEIAFSLLWLLLWCFVVNGSDTTESLHSIFSRLLSFAWPERALVSLSPALHMLTELLLTVFGALIIFYKRDMSTVWRKWGWRLAMLNGAFIILPNVIQTALFQIGVGSNYTNPFMEVLAWLSIPIDLLNIVFAARYLMTHKEAAIKVQILGWLIIIWSTFSLFSVVFLAAVLIGLIDKQWLLSGGFFG